MKPEIVAPPIPAAACYSNATVQDPEAAGAAPNGLALTPILLGNYTKGFITVTLI